MTLRVGQIVPYVMYLMLFVSVGVRECDWTVNSVNKLQGTFRIHSVPVEFLVISRHLQSNTDDGVKKTPKAPLGLNLDLERYLELTIMNVTEFCSNIYAE